MNIWRSDLHEMSEQHVHYLQFITARRQLTVTSLKEEASIDVW
jgi:hypothetical protein